MRILVGYCISYYWKHAKIRICLRWHVWLKNAYNENNLRSFCKLKNIHGVFGDFGLLEKQDFRFHLFLLIKMWLFLPARYSITLSVLIRHRISASFMWPCLFFRHFFNLNNQLSHECKMTQKKNKNCTVSKLENTSEDGFPTRKYTLANLCKSLRNPAVTFFLDDKHKQAYWLWGGPPIEAPLVRVCWMQRYKRWRRGGQPTLLYKAHREVGEPGGQNPC